MTQAVDFLSVRKDLPNGKPVLTNVSLTVAKGETVAIVGPSGSGKSTLLSLMGLLDLPDAGTVSLLGRDVRSLSGRERDQFRALHIGFIFQRFALLPHLSAVENVRLPLRQRNAGFHFKSDNSLTQALRCLEAVGLSKHANRRPSRLSGGEQQRVAIARALVTAPGLIVADEPTGSLDEITGTEILRLLLATTEESGAALVVVTHDMTVASNANTIYELHAGHLQMRQRA